MSRLCAPPEPDDDDDDDPLSPDDFTSLRVIGESRWLEIYLSFRLVSIKLGEEERPMGSRGRADRFGS